MTTYYIETIDNCSVFAYYDRLYGAKRDLLRFKDNEAIIVCLKGPYKYEGYHAYKMIYDGKRFKRVK